MPLSTLLLALSLLLTSTSAACESECEPLESQLSNCGLPPVLPIWLEGNTDIRNISGWLDDYTWNAVVDSEIGPRTRLVANTSQAECFCTDGRSLIIPCMRCHRRIGFHDGEDGNRYMEADRIRRDCLRFGYFPDDNLSYPSTTRSSMPSATAPPLSNLIEPGCDDVCGVLDSQALECNLTGLAVEGKPDRVDVPSPDYPARTARYILNRTAAECVCTLPVLRRQVACNECLRGNAVLKKDPAPRERLLEYGKECHQMGYWSDRKFIIPEAWLNEDDGGGPGSSGRDDSSPPSATNDETDGAWPIPTPMDLAAFSIIVIGLAFVL